MIHIEFLKLTYMGYLDYGARMYDAALGRWFAADPLGEQYARSQSLSFLRERSSFFGRSLRYDDYSVMPIRFRIKASSKAVSRMLSKRPVAPPCPESILVFRRRTESPVFKARNLAVHFAGSW